MPNLSSAFQDALADQAKSALVALIAKKPGTTVKELRQLVGDNPALGSLSLGELLGSEGGRGRGRKTATRKGARGKAGKGGVQKRNVRTEPGREAFDKEVLDGLKAAGGKNVSATDVRKALSADPTQLRTSLNRLIEKGLVTFTGKARGTRYSLA